MVFSIFRVLGWVVEGIGSFEELFRVSWGFGYFLVEVGLFEVLIKD